MSWTPAEAERLELIVEMPEVPIEVEALMRGVTSQFERYARLSRSIAPEAFMLAMSGSLTVVATHIAGARHFRIPWWYGLLFPLGLTAASMLAVNGVLKRARGVISWKGRVYRVP